MISSRSDKSLRAAHARIEGVRGSGSGEAVSAGRLEMLGTDVRDSAQIQRLFDATVDRLGGLDILVNNAGVGGFSEVAAQSPTNGDRLSTRISPACSIAAGRPSRSSVTVVEDGSSTSAAWPGRTRSLVARGIAHQRPV